MSGEAAKRRGGRSRETDTAERWQARRTLEFAVASRAEPLSAVALSMPSLLEQAGFRSPAASYSIQTQAPRYTAAPASSGIRHQLFTSTGAEASCPNEPERTLFRQNPKQLKRESRSFGIPVVVR